MIDDAAIIEFSPKDSACNICTRDEVFRFKEKEDRWCWVNDNGDTLLATKTTKTIDEIITWMIGILNSGSTYRGGKKT